MQAQLDSSALAQARLQRLQRLVDGDHGPAAEVGRALIDTFKQALQAMERSRKADEGTTTGGEAHAGRP
jgi:hypothetical protein